MRILGDDEARGLDPRRAVDAVHRALAAGVGNRLVGSPRVVAKVGEVGYVVTAGGVEGQETGFRAYRSEPAADHPELGRMRSSFSGAQLVVVWDGAGDLVGVVSGRTLGARRTGALGGLAVDVLAASEAGVLGLIGSGLQAWAQLWAISGVRTLRDVRVYSANASHAEAFARRATGELGVPARAVSDGEEAVSGAELVVLATNSSRPVIEAGWVSPGAHVNTIGPKWEHAYETPLELVERAAVLVSDSPEQAGHYPWPFFIPPERLVDLGAVVRHETPGREDTAGITMYCSTGLAGTEVVLAALLLKEYGA